MPKGRSKRQLADLVPYAWDKPMIDLAVELAAADWDLKAEFLNYYHKFKGNKSKALQFCGFSARRVEQWMQLDPDFAARCADVIQAVNDEMEDNIKDLAANSLRDNVKLAASRIWLEAHHPDYSKKRGDNVHDNDVQITLVIGRDKVEPVTIDEPKHETD